MHVIKRVWSVVATAGSLLAVLLAPTAAPSAELGRMAPADVARIKARTICSCLFVQRMTLPQCVDGRAAIWRYPSKEADPQLLVDRGQRLDVSLASDGGSVRLLAGERILAQSRYLADGGGCVTLGTEQVGLTVEKTQASMRDFAPSAAAMSDALPRGEFPSGVDSKRVHEILEEAFSTSGPLNGLGRAAVVVVDGRVVADRYATGYGPQNLYYVGSISKVFNNLLAGLLVRDGRLRVGDAVNFPQWRGTADARKRVTFDQMLKMVSGIAWDEEFWKPGEPGYEIFFGGPASRDVFGYLASRPLEAAPGTHFEYSTGSAALLAAALQNRLESPGRAALLQYLGKKLYAPLGAKQVVTEFDAQGHFLGGHGVFIGAEDLARIGMLLIGNGQWQSQRLLPEDWVAYSTKAALEGEGAQYGAQLQLRMADTPGCYGHPGVGESRLIVCPARHLVVAWLGSVFDFRGEEPFGSIERLTSGLLREFPERSP